MSVIEFEISGCEVIMLVVMLSSEGAKIEAQ